MPLLRRLPKFGFTPRNKEVMAVVNLKDLEARFDSGATVDRAALVEKGLIKKSYEGPVKVLGTGELKKKLIVKATAFSEKASAAIKTSGGNAEVVK
jgi:large subunit ribosomal protein L15